MPIYYDHFWYGVVAMDISVDTMKQLLVEAMDNHTEGEYQLYDTRLNMIATSESPESTVNHFDASELAQIAHAIESDTEGGFVWVAALSVGNGSIILKALSCACIRYMKGCEGISAASVLCWRYSGRSSPPCC
ncbi:hypothetical protein ACP3P6_11835 [Enterobacter mori]